MEEGVAGEKTPDGAASEAVVHLCCTPGCGKPASMACPTCLKLGLPASRFCGQECFKGNWNEHKLVHKSAQKEDRSKLPSEFRGYLFTGPLRPFQQSPRRTVPPEIPRPDYAEHPQGYPLSEQEDKRTGSVMKIYTKAEIDGIRAACRIGREVLDLAGDAVRAGITCDELDRIVHEGTVARGAYPSPLNYHRFPKSVICHGIPDYRELQDGDIVNIDVSVYYNGFHGDLNETFLVGNVDKSSEKIVEVAFHALQAAIATVRPGTLYRDVGTAISNITNPAKCSIVTSYCGHGIGQLFHTAPNVPHYPGSKAKGSMQIGHVFTIEPMINLGKSKDQCWPDNWTAVTSDGSRSAQFEHTMVVTETGCELLTARVGEPTDRLVWNIDTWRR